VCHRFVVSALVYLVLGLAVQALHMADIWLGISPLVYTPVEAVRQMLFMGWLTQVALAWLYGSVIKLPRASIAVWWCFNLGLVAVIAGQPLLVLAGVRLGGVMLLGGGLLQLAGAIILVAGLVATRRIRGGTNWMQDQAPRL
jgi:hypothetical protein